MVGRGFDLAHDMPWLVRKILCNPSASWFTIGKQKVRRHMVLQTSREDMCAYAYTSLMGCDSTRLIFDGASFIAEAGEMLSEGIVLYSLKMWS